MLWSDLRDNSVSRLEEQRGWLGANQRDPGADPPDMAGLRLTSLPVRSRDDGNE